MKGVATEKVPGGKLLRIKTEFDKKIINVQITGDFFAHPENCIEKIEKLIKGIKLNYDSTKLISKIEKLIKDNKYELIGIDANAIVRVLGESLR